jgi:hypothetical protein
MSRSSLSRKRYEMIAAAIATSHARARVKDDPYDPFTAQLIVRALATTFRNDNPAFQPTRFIDACGIDTIKLLGIAIYGSNNHG